MPPKRPKISLRKKRKLEITIDGEKFAVKAIEIPFREGTELETTVNGQLVRASDVGLGIQESLRILEEKIRKIKSLPKS